ncbi:hypothetical protein CR513_39584, partial [Mucuna pruriens]
MSQELKNAPRISDPKADLIIETNASNLGYGGFLNKTFRVVKIQVVKYHLILIHTDCKAVPSVFTKDVQNLIESITIMIKPINYRNPFEYHYLKKDELLPVIIFEKELVKQNSQQITKTIFPQDFHYPLIHPSKIRTFYEFVLLDSDSIELNHTKDQNGNIIFPKSKDIKCIKPTRLE